MSSTNAIATITVAAIQRTPLMFSPLVIARYPYTLATGMISSDGQLLRTRVPLSVTSTISSSRTPP